MIFALIQLTGLDGDDWLEGRGVIPIRTKKERSVMASTMRNEMQAPVYPAADLARACRPASISTVAHWSDFTVAPKANVATEFATKRQRPKERFD